MAVAPQSGATFLGLFFFLALGPTSNLLLRMGSIMAERFLYLPSIGFAGCLMLAVFATGHRWQAAFAVAILLVFGCERTNATSNGKSKTALGKQSYKLS